MNNLPQEESVRLGLLEHNKSTTTEESGQPHVAIIIPIMDRADDLRNSLPNLLGQDYSNYTVYIVDNSSRDALEAVLDEMKHPRLKLIRCPRSTFFNFSKSRNIGARYTFSNLLFFLNGDNQFRDPSHLSQIIDDFLTGAKIDYHWYRTWRSIAGSDPETGRRHYHPLKIPHRVYLKTSHRRVYCHCLGSPTLIDRQVFQQFGGFNEALEGWGYEDTDLIARLELAGFGRIAISGITQPSHSDDIRVKNFREKDRRKSWEQNRQLSDNLISSLGPVISIQKYPGRCEWVEMDGIQYDGASAPQQQWEMMPQVLTHESLREWLVSALRKLLRYLPL